ncbi:NCS2 family permease [Gulosibacter chungangensis]|uniref:NCS2 family permease n=1 Tax=Gulosibacter chungangensis TaxID=979746 RepID=A0A7J5B984_9MICO|nr:NCS2 family permease [Gulosibacter chungangensis]KAB1641948.1 NCS2 family permease [Gulosibacter chungangensis]
MSNQTEQTQAPKPASPALLERLFQLGDRKSNINREIRGGVVTFITISYILVLNPIILAGASSPDVDGNYLDAVQVASATALASGLLTILFGLVANLPFALSAGLGINSFLAVSMVHQITWPEAMGLVLLNGVIIVILGATGARTAIFHAVPPALKSAITVGIGMFIAFVGLVNSGFVTQAQGTPVQLGLAGSITTIPTVIFVITLLLMAILLVRKVPGAILIGIAVGTVIALIAEAIWRIGAAGEDNPSGWGLTVPSLPDQIVSIPDLGLIGQFDLFGSFERIGPVAALMLLLTLVFMNFFDAIGAMTGLARNAGLANEDGTFPRIRQAFIIEGLGAVVGGATSTSSNTIYVDSASGIGEGARTGLASVVTGLLFIVAMFFTPLAVVVPMEVGSAALVVVGALMMAQVSDIRWNDLAVAIPAFLTIISMPLTYSIANGIGIGFVAWVIIHALAGRVRQVHWLMWVVAAGFVIFFARTPLEALLG